MSAVVLTYSSSSQAQTVAKKSAPAATARPKPKPAVTPANAAAPAPMTDEQKTIYALGLSVYRSLAQFDLSLTELEVLERALSDAAAKKPAVDINEWGPKIQALAQARATRVRDREKAASQAYLDKAASEPGAAKTPSGLVYREITPGSGASPKAMDTVSVNYRGTLVDGTEFDSSYRTGKPAQFPLNGVIPCWTEGLQKMKVGGKAILSCPSSVAYGDAGRPGIPGGAALIFEIELLDIVNATGSQ